MLPSTPTLNAHQNAAAALETPSPPSAVNEKFNSSTVTELMSLVEMGVLTKKDVRLIMFKRFQIKQEPATPEPATPEPVTQQNVKKRRLPTPSEIDQQIDRAVSMKRPRPGKSSPRTSQLRKLVKDPTRRRFLSQCCDINSVLWPKREGHYKREINKLLFARAAQDPIADLYSTYPGALHSVSNHKLLGVVRWQVPPLISLR